MLSITSLNSPAAFDNSGYADAAVKSLKHGRCCQSIVPDHIFEHIAANHPKHKVRQNAQDHLDHIREVRKIRHEPRFHNVEEGISKGGDPETILIYDAKHKKALPGTEWKDRTFHHWDESAKRAHDGLSKTYLFFSNELKRNSIDNKGMQLMATVHYKKGYNNAFWTGSDSTKDFKGQMVFGDGDGKIFNDFTIDEDVTAHELGHGVTEYSAGSSTGIATGLNYTDDEAGGLNEAFSDMAGSVVKQYTHNQKAHDADWLIGEHLFKVRDGVRGLRDMVNPGTAYDNPKIGKDLQVKDVPALQQFIAENGKKVDPHIGSGPANRAFALAAIELEEESWKRAYVVMYNTLPLLKPDATYLECAEKSIQVAQTLFHDDPKVEGAFVKAWTAVGVLR